MIPFFISIPHSGEKVPEEAFWLKGLEEKILMCDVDRYVDQIYLAAINELNIPNIKTEWHRYAVDLNRFPDDIDSSTVANSKTEAGKYSRGFHWAITTKRQVLMPKPMSEEVHAKLVKKYYEPFHKNITDQVDVFRKNGAKNIYHLDVHSMPSMGTSEHRDPGESRADFVVSDFNGKSSSSTFKDLVLDTYASAGFKVAYNWPYIGGRITEMYGKPSLGHHTIQVEMNRKLYMNEDTKRLMPELVREMSEKIRPVLSQIYRNISSLS